MDVDVYPNLYSRGSNFLFRENLNDPVSSLKKEQTRKDRHFDETNQQSDNYGK